MSISALNLERPYKSDILSARPSSPLDYLCIDRVTPAQPAKKKRSGITAAIEGAFEHLRGLYVRYIPASLRGRLSWVQDLPGKVFNLIENVVKVVKPLFQTIWNSSGTFEDINREILPFTMILRKLPLFSACGFVRDVYNIARDVNTFVRSAIKKSCDAMVESGLKFTGHIGDLSVTAASIIGVLKVFEVIPAGIASIVSLSLTSVGAAFSLGMIALHAKDWYDNARLRVRILKHYNLKEGTEENFKHVVEELSKVSNSTLKKMFGVTDGGEMKVRLKAVWERNKELSTEQRGKIREAMCSLKKRSITKDICLGLKILAALVTVAATVALLCSPAAPAGFVLLATAAAISIAVITTEIITSIQFEKKLRTLAPNDDPIVARYHWENGGKKTMRKKIDSIMHWQPIPKF